MNIIKRIASIAIAVILVCTLCVTAFAVIYNGPLYYGSRFANYYLGGDIGSPVFTASLSAGYTNNVSYYGDRYEIHSYYQYYDVATSRYSDVFYHPSGMKVDSNNTRMSINMTKPANTYYNYYVWNRIEATYVATDVYNNSNRITVTTGF